MAKIEPLVDVGSLANTTGARAVINANSERIEVAFDNTLSRDGSSPNQMEADFDLNDHYLLNLADPVNEADGVNLRSVRPLVEQFAAEIVETAVFGTQVVDPFTATPGQFSFSLSESPGAIENVTVFVDGVALEPGTEFNLSGATLQTLTLTTPLSGGERVIIRYAKALPSGVAAAGSVLYAAAGAGAVVRTVQDRLRDTLNVLDYVPPALHASIKNGTNTTDLLAYINAALADALATGKAEIVFPAGDYRVSAAITVTQSQLCLRGEGRARLISTSLTDHILVIGDGVGNPGNIKITGLAFSATAQKSAGAAVYVRNGNDIRLADIICAVNLWDGVVFEGGAAQFGYYLDGYLATFFRGDGIRQQIGGGINIQDVHVSNALIDATAGQAFGAVGIRLLSGGGSYYRFVDILGGANSIVTLPPTGSAVNYSFFDQVLADTPQGDAWDLHDAGGNVLSWSMSNCWGNTSVNGNGFRSRGTGAGKIRNVQISNSIFANNSQNGVLWDRTDDHKIVDSTVSGNNTSNTAGTGGISIAAACSNWIVSDNIIDNEWFFGIGANQKFAVNVAAGASNNYVITGNISKLNAAHFVDAGTGTSKNTSGNVPALRTFIAPTLLNSWVNFGGSWEEAGYWKDENNMVHLRGSIKSGTVPGTLFALPAGYLPAKDHAFATIGGTNVNAVNGVVVKSGGNVDCSAGASNVILCLDGICFPAA